MRLAGTWSRYSNSAMPQLTNAATNHGRSARFLRCAYQANVMKPFESTSRSAVFRTTDIVPPKLERNGANPSGPGLDCADPLERNAMARVVKLGIKRPAYRPLLPDPEPREATYTI